MAGEGMHPLRHARLEGVKEGSPYFSPSFPFPFPYLLNECIPSLLPFDLLPFSLPCKTPSHTQAFAVVKQQVAVQVANLPEGVLKAVHWR
jgi:hypothetical protein